MNEFETNGYCTITVDLDGVDPAVKLTEVANSRFGVQRTVIDEIAVRPASAMQSYTDRPMTLHTDNVYLDVPCRIMALFCIIEDPTGGRSILRDFQSLHLDSDVIDAMHRPRWRWVGPNGNVSSPQAVIDSDGSIRWWRRTLTDLTDPQRWAADLLESAVSSPDGLRTVQLRRGQILFVNNRRVLHGRGPILNPSRRYLRLWGW